jgi:hypothetical protein
LPSFQSGFTTGNRGTPDVSYDANPSSGVAVYDSYGSGGWAQFGGTSAGAPQWAALIAIADQGRALAGKGSLANAQDAIYTLSSSDFHDITGGSNGLSATAGYDLSSGRGSPIASSVIRDLVSYGGATTFTVKTATTTPVRTSGFSWGWGGWFFDVSAGGGSAGAVAAIGASADAAAESADVSVATNNSTTELASLSADGNAAVGITYNDESAVQMAQCNDEALRNMTAASEDSSAVISHDHSTNLNDTSAAHAALDAFFAQLENSALSHGSANVA